MAIPCRAAIGGTIVRRVGLLVYWLLLGVLAFASLVYQRRYRWGADGTAEIDPGLSRQSGLFIALVAIALLVGLRYQVGGDWNGYLHLFRLMQQWPLSIALRLLARRVGLYPSELAGRAGRRAVLAGEPRLRDPVRRGAVGLQPPAAQSLARANGCGAAPDIIVVAMGYTRQAAAMGFMLIGLTGL